MDSLTRGMARFTLSLQYEQIPPIALHEARRFLLDSLGCAYAALRNDDMQAAHRFIEKLGGMPAATVIGSGLRTNAPYAALMNSLLIRALDYNDIYWKQDPSHPSDLIPAAMACAEWSKRSTREQLVGIVIAYLLVAFFWLKKNIRPAWRQIMVFWAGFLIVLIPEGSYILRQTNQFMSRFNAEGTFSSGWLANEIVITGKSGATILFDRVVHAFLSLIYYPAFEFYGSYIPIISMVTAVLFIMGLVYILIRARSLKMLLLNGYFWGATAAVGLFAIPPSADSYRMLVALPAAIIIAAIGLDQILTRLGIGIKTRPFHYATITSVIMVSLFIFNIWAYFFDFIGQCRYGGDVQTRFASYVGNYAQGIRRETNIYLLSNEIYRNGTHDSVYFLAGNRPITNVDDPMDDFEPVSGEIIIANPDRIGELRAWSRTHPGGELQYIFDCQKEIMLVYKVP